MKRRHFLKVFGIGSAVVGTGALTAIGMPLSPEQDFNRRVAKVCKDMLNKKLHSLDGIIILSDLKDENKELFQTYIKNNKNFVPVVRMCAKYLVSMKGTEKEADIFLKSSL